MAHVPQFAGRLAFAIEPRIGIGPRLMRLVAALATFEVVRAAAVVVLIVTVLAHEALVSRPRLDQRAVDAEVFAREQILLLSYGHYFVEEFDDRIVLDQSLAILREDRGHPHLVIHCQADKPTKKPVILNLLHQLPLRADVVENLDQHGSQQLLWRDARPPVLYVRFVHPGEQSIHLRQRFVRHHADRSQRMRLRDEVVQLPQGKQTPGERVGAAHDLQWASEGPNINA
ncbi:hypothetical protein LMG24235_08506 [Paraburkholderia sabiae]|nr:hypothetical protein LMG24235_08506 [Paraburkholderia sabiae]